MDIKTPIQVRFHQFECTYNMTDDLGMEIGHGDDPEGAIDGAFSREGIETHEFAQLSDLASFLGYTRYVGLATRRLEGGIQFHYGWFDDYYSEKGIHSRIYCEDPAVVEFVWNLFQRKQYDPMADARDYLDTERDRYSPEL